MPTDAAVSATQPFRFLDLPLEIRFMVYENLRDNEVTIRFEGLEVDYGTTQAFISSCVYPDLLLVNKQFGAEYSGDIFKQASLHAEYECDSNRFDTCVGRFLPDQILHRIKYLQMDYHVFRALPDGEPFKSMSQFLFHMDCLTEFAINITIDLRNHEWDNDDAAIDYFVRFSKQLRDFLLALNKAVENLEEKVPSVWCCRLRLPLYTPRLSRDHLVAAPDIQLPPLSPPIWHSAVYSLPWELDEEGFVFSRLNLEFSGIEVDDKHEAYVILE